MCSNMDVSILSQNVVVFPSRAVAIENLLRLFLPQLAIVDEQLSHHLPRQWLTSLKIEVFALSIGYNPVPFLPGKKSCIVFVSLA